MTTQEPVGDPGLDALRSRYDSLSFAVVSAAEHNDTIAMLDFGSQSHAAFAALVAHIEAQVIAPWREALDGLFHEAALYRSCIASGERLNDDDNARWADVMLHARALLHPNAEGGD